MLAGHSRKQLGRGRVAHMCDADAVGFPQDSVVGCSVQSFGFLVGHALVILYRQVKCAEGWPLALYPDQPVNSDNFFGVELRQQLTVGFGLHPRHAQHARIRHHLFTRRRIPEAIDMDLWHLVAGFSDKAAQLAATDHQPLFYHLRQGLLDSRQAYRQRRANFRLVWKTPPRAIISSANASCECLCQTLVLDQFRLGRLPVAKQGAKGQVVWFRAHITTLILSSRASQLRS